jgi:acetyl esterase
MLKLFVALALAAVSAFGQASSDVEYARPDSKPLLLDISIPDGKGPFPTAIIVHGGSWIRGDKTTYIKPLKPLLSTAGYAWFSIDYRLAPAYTYPSPVEDVEAAIRWVRTNADKYKVDVNRIALIGESAGGHLVAMVGARNKPESRVAAVVDFYGPHDLALAAKLSPAPGEGIHELFNISAWNEQTVKTAHDGSPIYYVQKDMPPFLFIHGTADKLVPFMSSPMMCEAMKKAGATCKVVEVPGGVHGMENWEGKPGEEAWKPVMISWLNDTLGLQTTSSK